jgi:hypothetical protein
VAVYFAILLAKPQFTTLCLNNNKSNLDFATALQKVGGFIKYVLGGLYLGIRLARSSKNAFLVVYVIVGTWYLIAVSYSMLQQSQRFGPIFAASSLFLLSLLLSGLLGYQVIGSAENTLESRETSRLDDLIQGVLAVLPKKVSVGETHNIEIEFDLTSPIASRDRYEAELGLLASSLTATGKNC